MTNETQHTCSACGNEIDAFAPTNSAGHADDCPCMERIKDKTPEDFGPDEYTDHERDVEWAVRRQE